MLSQGVQAGKTWVSVALEGVASPCPMTTTKMMICQQTFRRGQVSPLLLILESLRDRFRERGSLNFFPAGSQWDKDTLNINSHHVHIYIGECYTHFSRHTGVIVIQGCKLCAMGIRDICTCGHHLMKNFRRRVARIFPQGPGVSWSMLAELVV